MSEHEKPEDSDGSEPAASAPPKIPPRTPHGVPATPPQKPRGSFRERGLAEGLETASALFAKNRAQRLEIREDQERWLLRTDGVDYGPFDAVTVRNKLEAEEINEYTVVTDSVLGEIYDLIDTPYFTDFVIEYIPRRNQRRVEAEQRRQELVEEVKRRSVRASFSVAFGAVGLAMLGLVLLHLTGILPFKDVMETVRPTPQAFPIEQVVRGYRFHFEVPEPEYQAITADQALVASLFEKKPSGSSRSRSSSRDRFDTEGTEEYTLDFDSTKPASKLSQSEVNATINRYASRIGSCFQEEMQNNANFKGATLRFSINPSGKTFSVRASTEGGKMSSTAEGCLVRAVRSMRFPQFNDVPMSVAYPFYVN